MFVQETWRGQRVVGWCSAPPVPPALVLPGQRHRPTFSSGSAGPDVVGGSTEARRSAGPVRRDGADPGGRVPDCLSVDGGLLELAAWRAALVAAPAGEVASLLRSRPPRPVACSAIVWEQVLVDSLAARQQAMAYEAAQQT